MYIIVHETSLLDTEDDVEVLTASTLISVDLGTDKVSYLLV